MSWKAPRRGALGRFGALAAMPDLVENSLCYGDGERLISMVS
jgi:hypothetical protein